MIKIYDSMIVGALAWCAAAQACSPRLDGGETYCPPDFGIDDGPKLPKEEMKGDIDVYNIHHWSAIQGMFIRNQRRKQIEENATPPSDAIDSALTDFYETHSI